MTRPEQKLQTAIVRALRRRFECFVTHVPNGGARTALEALAFIFNRRDLIACVEAAGRYAGLGTYRPRFGRFIPEAADA